MQYMKVFEKILPASWWPIWGWCGAIGPANSTSSMVNTSTSPEIFEGTNQIVSGAHLSLGFQRWSSHTIAGTIVTGSLPWKMLGGNMEALITWAGSTWGGSRGSSRGGPERGRAGGGARGGSAGSATAKKSEGVEPKLAADGSQSQGKDNKDLHLN